MQLASRDSSPTQQDGSGEDPPMKARLESHALDASHRVFTTDLDAPELLTSESFERLWQLRPAEPPRIRMLGRIVPLPRRQKAFGRDYAFSGTVSVAADIPDELAPFLSWAQNALDARLNGLLLNWYDGEQGDYIGAHRDSEVGLIPGSRIVTISLGATRTFRMDRVGEKARRDFTVGNGSVLIIPWETNRAWKHGVPHFARDTGRRISITLRAFVGEK